MKEENSAPKREEKSEMAAQKCATEKKFRDLCRTTYKYLKNNRRKNNTQ